MASRLNRLIETGERIVVTAESMPKKYHDLPERIFIATGGFGMAPDTSGTKIYGHWEKDNKEGYIRGYNISIQETKDLKLPFVS